MIINVFDGVDFSGIHSADRAHTRIIPGLGMITVPETWDN